MHASPSILSALLRLLVMLAFAALMFSMPADALDFSRNGKSVAAFAAVPQGLLP
tara:strand:- start:4185 stop:4346 length:162 start_codon:yes stop_codon:yes gene_type:complete